MQCPNCQHWNEVGSRFCEDCGAELTEQQPASAKVSVRATTPADAIVPDPPEQDLIPPIPAPAAVGAHTGPRLVLERTGSIFRLGDAATIGREDATLQIDLDGYPDGKFVSHHHAQITKVDEQYYVEDLGSSNHTWVNDIKLAQGQAEPLKEGDVLRLGKLELIFHQS